MFLLFILSFFIILSSDLSNYTEGVYIYGININNTDCQNRLKHLLENYENSLFISEDYTILKPDIKNKIPNLDLQIPFENMYDKNLSLMNSFFYLSQSFYNKIIINNNNNELKGIYTNYLTMVLNSMLITNLVEKSNQNYTNLYNLLIDQIKNNSPISTINDNFVSFYKDTLNSLVIFNKNNFSKEYIELLNYLNNNFMDKYFKYALTFDGYDEYIYYESNLRSKAVIRTITNNLNPTINKIIINVGVNLIDHIKTSLINLNQNLKISNTQTFPKNYSTYDILFNKSFDFDIDYFYQELCKETLGL